MKPYLLELREKFTKIELRQAMSMKSAHAIRIYELLKQYEKIGSRTITVEDLRGYCGIMDGDYPLFSNFRDKVIEIAKREINSKTDISFEYGHVKEGRKVVAIRFDISRKHGTDTADEIREDPKLSFLLSRLTSHGMSEAAARKYVAGYPAEVIESAVKELESRLKTKAGAEKIANPPGWLCSAIEDPEGGYGTQKTIFQAEQEQKKLKQKAQEAEAAERQAKDTALTQAYRKHATDYITAFIA